ncbi:mCG62406, partial [Mus musculus]
AAPVLGSGSFRLYNRALPINVCRRILLQRRSSWPVERVQEVVPKTREKKHLQARAKTPCYREDSELHHGEGAVNKGSCKTDC